MKARKNDSRTSSEEINFAILVFNTFPKQITRKKFTIKATFVREKIAKVKFAIRRGDSGNIYPGIESSCTLK
jgi:hypothetical protein